MKLYHFTAVHHLHGGLGHPGPGILNNGILPTIHPYLDLASGIVWLTSSPEWDQTWSTRDVPIPGFGGCNRTEVRLEVTIPRASRSALRPWSEIRHLALTDQLARDLESYGDPDNWFVFAGRIRPSWIRQMEPKVPDAAS